MESPPKPKRIIPIFGDLSASLVSSEYIASKSNTSSPRANIHKNSDYVASVVPLHSLSTSTKTVENQKEATNLCAFVDEVAAQQKLQMDELESRKHVLEIKTQQLNLCKKSYKNIMEESNSIKRKTFLASEEKTKYRVEITQLRDQILSLLDEESKLQKNIKLSHLNNFESFKKTSRLKMRLHESKLEQSGPILEINKQIADAKSMILCYQNQTNKIQCEIDNSTSPVNKLNEKIDAMRNEKVKLLNILHRKEESLKNEESKLHSLSLDLETTKKRVAAQKLRLRNRVVKKRHLMQQFEQEAMVLQIEIDDLKGSI